MNTEVSPGKEERERLSPSASRISYFESLNQELNEKIERIKRKYENDRQRLQTCYDMGSRIQDRAYLPYAEDNPTNNLLKSRAEPPLSYSPHRNNELNQSYAKRYALTSSPSKVQPYYYRTIENSNLRENLNNISNRHPQVSNYDRINSLSYSSNVPLYPYRYT